MSILPIVRGTTASSVTGYKDTEERSTKSIVRVKDGETIVIGGLLRRDYSNQVKKLPFLGDLPIVGAAFRHRYKDTDKERELLVFITPRIIKDTAKELAPMKKINLSEREQSAALAIDRQSLVAASLNNFEKKSKF
jgi:type II secretory pathway component GspD/PulD (secretin)